ncbi:MAG: hypothetical protein R3C05_13510 [Pirellulaceae bacterium]
MKTPTSNRSGLPKAYENLLTKIRSPEKVAWFLLPIKSSGVWARQFGQIVPTTTWPVLRSGNSALAPVR